MTRALVLAISLLLAGCATGSMRRDLDVSGDLPRAISLGAFAPMCLFLCLVENKVTQGDVSREEIVEGEPFVIHDKTSAEVKGKGKGKGVRAKRKK